MGHLQLAAPHVPPPDVPEEPEVPEVPDVPEEPELPPSALPFPIVKS